MTNTFPNKFSQITVDNTEYKIEFNGYLYVRADLNNDVTVLLKESQDDQFGIIDVIIAGTCKVSDVKLPTEKSIIKVTGGTSFIKVFS